jgi:hypothetical protein
MGMWHIAAFSLTFIGNVEIQPFCAERKRESVVNHCIVQMRLGAILLVFLAIRCKPFLATNAIIAIQRLLSLLC